MANIDNAYTVEILSLGDNVIVVAGASDPSVVGYEAPTGSLFLQTNGQVYTKVGPLDTEWKLTGWIDKLEDLLDVQLSNLQPGEILQFNGTSWVNVDPIGDTDERVKVSANDTSAGYIENKVVPGMGIGVSTLNDGGNETFQIRNTIPPIVKEPTGFPTRATSQLSFNSATGELTIQPLAPATEFEYYIQGTQYIVNTAKTATATSSVMTYFYFDTAKVLQTTQLYTEDLLLNYSYVAAVYWNQATNELIYLGDERHGVIMDGATHIHLHRIIGTQWITGLGIDNIVLGDGNSNTHAQCNVGNGKIRDEDLCHDIYNIGGKVNPYDHEQQLDPIAQIPVLWRTGTGTWKIKTADNFPFIYSGTAGYTGVDGLPPYNYFDGTNWSLVQVPNNHFFLVHVLATNDINHPIVALQGTTEYQNKPKGREAAVIELSNYTGLSFEEFTPIGTLIFEVKTNYANTPKARLVATEDGNPYVDWRRLTFNTLSLGAGASDHGMLSGLLDDDHPQYSYTVPGTTRVVTDVNSPQPGQYLRYNGTSWVNVRARPRLSRHNGAVVQTFTTTPVIVLFNTNVRNDSIFTYNAGVITVSESGWYEVSYDISVAVTNNNETNTQAEILINGTPLTGTLSYMHHRIAAQGRGTSSGTVAVNLAVNDTISIRASRTSGIGSLTTLANACRLNIQQIDGP